jgi:hypothetical protein
MKNRVIWKMLVLTIVTLGIYRLYWFVKTRREMMDNDSSIKILSPFVVVIPFVLVIASVVFLIFSTVQSIKDIPEYCENYTSSSYNRPDECELGAESAISFFFVYASILLTFPFVLAWLWSYSKGVEKITNEKMGFAISLLILYLVPDGIDILLVQDAFNKISPNVETPIPPQTQSQQPITT